MVVCNTRFAIYALPKQQTKSQADRVRRSLAAQMPPTEKQHLLSWSCFAKLIVFFTFTGKDNIKQSRPNMTLLQFFSLAFVDYFSQEEQKDMPDQSGSAFLQPQLQLKARHITGNGFDSTFFHGVIVLY